MPRSSLAHVRPTSPSAAAAIVTLGLAALVTGCGDQTAQITFRQPIRATPTLAELEAVAKRVEIVRTEYGIPHLRALDLEALAFGMAFVQAEDYGLDAVRSLISARGESALHLSEPDRTRADGWDLLALRRAIETYPRLSAETRDMLDGFADGINYYVRLNPDDFPEGLLPNFTGMDVSALTVGMPNIGIGDRIRRELEGRARPTTLDPARRAGDPTGIFGPEGAEGGEGAEGAEEEAPRAGERESRRRGGARAPDGDAETVDLDDPFHPFGTANPDLGSNTWALGPTRTRNGHAILLRNPHLRWDAGYYEAHLTVPGVLNWYGDIRIGGAFAIIGGFNDRLGWSTTNNAPDREEVYRLARDANDRARYVFDGAAHRPWAESVEVAWRDPDGATGTVVETFGFTHIGPIVHETDDAFYVVRAANDGEFRRSEQYLRMMQAQTLDEWKDAMRMHAIDASNYTYADADGNIFYVWNAKQPLLPHQPGGDDRLAIDARGTDDIWTGLLAWDSLPRLQNPSGGYVQNANDPPHLTNLRAPLDPGRYPSNVPAPNLRLRSQHSLLLIGGDERLSLEEVLDRKHSTRMLLAERVKDDLLAAVDDAGRAGGDATEALTEAVRVLGDWDDTVAPDSRGGVLFAAWWSAYRRALADGADEYAEPWSIDRPLSTPDGLSDAGAAVTALAEAADSVRSRWGALDVAWGDVHRASLGDLDLPMSGCSGSLGCFRVVSYADAEDGHRHAYSGDGWILAVEFSSPPRARTVLAYGQSNREGSPHDADQLEMFVSGETKVVRFTPADVEAGAIERYRPGER